jgi:hypothetical protein
MYTTNLTDKQQLSVFKKNDIFYMYVPNAEFLFIEGSCFIHYCNYQVSDEVVMVSSHHSHGLGLLQNTVDSISKIYNYNLQTNLRNDLHC